MENKYRDSKNEVSEAEKNVRKNFSNIHHL